MGVFDKRDKTVISLLQHNALIIKCNDPVLSILSHLSRGIERGSKKRGYVYPHKLMLYCTFVVRRRYGAYMVHIIIPSKYESIAHQKNAMPSIWPPLQAWRMLLCPAPKKLLQLRKPQATQHHPRALQRHQRHGQFHLGRERAHHQPLQNNIR